MLNFGCEFVRKNKDSIIIDLELLTCILYYISYHLVVLDLERVVNHLASDHLILKYGISFGENDDWNSVTISNLFYIILIKLNNFFWIIFKLLDINNYEG